MGVVYLARDRRNDRLLAVKILPPKKAKAQEHLIARFRREMEVCRRVAHPHITQTYEAGSLQGVHYIAMEYIAGRSLFQIVKSGGPLSVPRTAQIFVEVCAALGYAHGEGLIHRDLKPSNLMLTFEGRAKVLDFGLALMMDEEPPTDKTIAGGQGYVVGTMDYIAPEQAEDPLGVDPRCDLYSLGCTLFFTLTGQPPFPGGSALKKIMKHRTQRAPFITDLNPTVPTAFAQFVERLMAKAPDDRPASAADVLHVLRPWAADAPEPLNELGPDDTPTIINLEAPVLAAPGLWDQVSVMPFVAPAGNHEPRLAAPAAPRRPWHNWFGEHAMWIWSIAFLLGGAVLLAVAVIFIRR
jgi:serine/threonine protein kinase